MQEFDLHNNEYEPIQLQLSLYICISLSNHLAMTCTTALYVLLIFLSFLALQAHSAHPLYSGHFLLCFFPSVFWANMFNVQYYYECSDQS